LSDVLTAALTKTEKLCNDILVITSFLARLCVKWRSWANKHSLFHCTIRHFCEDVRMLYYIVGRDI